MQFIYMLYYLYNEGVEYTAEHLLHISRVDIR